MGKGTREKETVEITFCDSQSPLSNRPIKSKYSACLLLD
jgi:hypothetical protein